MRRHAGMGNVLVLKDHPTYEQDEDSNTVLDEEGNRRAVKEKTQIKYYPPDVSAAKACLELEGGENFSEYTDEELAAEKERLLRELQALNGKTKT